MPTPTHCPVLRDNDGEVIFIFFFIHCILYGENYPLIVFEVFRYFCRYSTLCHKLYSFAISSGCKSNEQFSPKTLFNMNNTNFRIRPYSKRELARLYFPDTVNEESAIANLRNLMKHNPHLIAELKGAYYKTYNKTFTPRQIGIIVQYLGEP